MCWFSCEILLSLSVRKSNLGMWPKVPESMPDSLQLSNFKTSTEFNPSNIPALMDPSSFFANFSLINLESSLNEPDSILCMGLSEMYKFISNGIPMNMFLWMLIRLFPLRPRPVKEGRHEYPPGEMWLILLSSRIRCLRDVKPSQFSALTSVNWFELNTITSQSFNSEKAPDLMLLMLFPCRLTEVASTGISGTSWRFSNDWLK